MVAIVLCALVMTPLSYTEHSFKVTTAHAQWAVVVVEDLPRRQKDFLLDLIQWILVDIVLAQIIDDVLAWVASGFQGDPAFVTDLEGYLVNIADETAGNFIYGSELGVLCSPFKLEVQTIIETHYFQRDRNFQNQAQCRLSDVVDNVDAFLNDGDFYAGGWDGWFNLTQRSSNNPYGALVLAEAEMKLRIVNQQGRESTLLDWGSGFLSFKNEDCDVSVDPTCKQILTPGAVIEEQVNKTLGIEMDRLVTADELDETFAALATSLVTRIVQGNGLRGISSSEFVNQSLKLLPLLEEHWIQPETRWLRELQRGLSAIEDAVEYAEAKCAPADPPPLPSNLAASQNRLQAQVAESEANLVTLNGFADRIRANPSPEEQGAIAAEFQQIPQRTDQAIEELGEEIDDVVDAALAYQQNVDSLCERGGGQ